MMVEWFLSLIFTILQNYVSDNEGSELTGRVVFNQLFWDQVEVDGESFGDYHHGKLLERGNGQKKSFQVSHVSQQSYSE